MRAAPAQGSLAVATRGRLRAVAAVHPVGLTGSAGGRLGPTFLLPPGGAGGRSGLLLPPGFVLLAAFVGETGLFFQRALHPRHLGAEGHHVMGSRLPGQGTIELAFLQLDLQLFLLGRGQGV